MRLLKTLPKQRQGFLLSGSLTVGRGGAFRIARIGKGTLGLGYGDCDRMSFGQAGRSWTCWGTAAMLAVASVAWLLAKGADEAAAQAAASAPPKRHAISLLGEPAYKADFKHFDWVNPDAPKGGSVKLWSEGAFDNLNPFTLVGVAAAELENTYDSLMVSSADELSVTYGLIAAWASYPPDFSSVTFGLRPEARFHDGKPITADDVIFSMEALKKANVRYAQAYRDVVRGERIGPHEVKFHFAGPGNSKLPQQVSLLTVLPKHYWEGRDLSKTTLEPPLGSGPYRIRDVDRGRSIIYERVANYWGRDLPVNRGQWNFQEIRIDYFLDRNAAFEQFKAGGIDYWYENSAKSWATEYEFPAVKRGFVIADRVAHIRPTPMQAFGMNQRRPQFRDIRVRQALNLAFNYEEMNDQLLYSAYRRTSSYFDNSRFKPRGAPQARELALLEEARKVAPEGVPDTVFKEALVQPVGGNYAVHRRNLAAASALLKEAGYAMSPGGVLRDARGQPLSFEVLLSSPTFTRHVQNYAADLRKLGVLVRVRVVDTAQYQARIRKFDFDMNIHLVGQASVPGNEQRQFWVSDMADREGSQNILGIKNKAIDFVVEKIVFAKSLEELEAATRALDRLLMHNHYVVAQWHYTFDRFAYWDKFGRPAKLPSVTPGLSFDRVWWFDEAKARDLAARRAK